MPNPPGFGGRANNLFSFIGKNSVVSSWPIIFITLLMFSISCMF